MVHCASLKGKKKAGGEKPPYLTLLPQINEWCRKAFQRNRGKIRDLSDLAELRERIDHRIEETDSLSFSQLLDSLLWLIIEDTTFRPWFPDGCEHGYMATFEEKLRKNGIYSVFTSRWVLITYVPLKGSATANEKTEYWRAYSTSLLFQSPETKERLVRKAEALAAEIWKYTCGIRIGEEHVLEPAEPYRRRLCKIAFSVTSLAAEMKCQ
jgi:hypothetical protein